MKKFDKVKSWINGLEVSSESNDEIQIRYTIKGT